MSSVFVKNINYIRWYFMRLKKDVHGRKMNINLEVKGMILSDLYRELERKNWNINKLSKRAKTTYDDCKLRKIYGNIKDKNEENFIKNLRRHILTLYDDEVGSYFAGMYLYCYEIYNDSSCAIQNMKTEIKNDNSSITKYSISKVIKSAKSNCEYLNFINDSYCDRQYIANWGYYDSDRQLTEILKVLYLTAVEPNEISYFHYKLGNENKLYYKMKNASNFNFDNPIIKHRKIKKNEKIRKIYTVDKKTDEYIIIKFLKKKLDLIFQIKYPNRSEIMPELFSLIKEIECLTNYTIYKFDFKNFFETIDAKIIWNNHIKDVFFEKYIKDLLERYIDENQYCYQGLALSNVFAEIAGKYFDRKIKYTFNSDGLIFYARYVDDGLLIFNKDVELEKIRERIIEIAKEIFGNRVRLNEEKERYYTKYMQDNLKNFTYLGYLFKFSDKKYKFGIAKEKLEKYGEEIDKITLEYLNNGDVELFRQRILFFISRRVYYNVFASNNKIAKWDVAGITANYNLLRQEIMKKNYGDLENNTIDFFTKQPHKNAMKIIKNHPLGKKLYFYNNKKSKPSYCIMSAFKNNKSIVFHPNIGWSTEYLCKKIRKIDNTFKVHNKTYRECVTHYNYLLKIPE